MSTTRQPLMTSSAIAPSGRFYQFVFTKDTFNGPIIEPTTGRTEYLIETPLSIVGRSATTVNRADGSTVGSIDWKGRLISKKTKRMVTLHGQSASISDILKTFIVGPRTKQVWADPVGNEFYWAGGSCYNALDQLIAQYISRKKHLVRDNEPAHLMVDSNFLPLLDHILFTTLIIEHAARDNDGGDGGGDGGDGGDDGGGGDSGGGQAVGGGHHGGHHAGHSGGVFGGGGGHHGGGGGDGGGGGWGGDGGGGGWGGDGGGGGWGGDGDGGGGGGDGGGGGGGGGDGGGGGGGC